MAYGLVRRNSSDMEHLENTIKSIGDAWKSCECLSIQLENHVFLTTALESIEDELMAMWDKVKMNWEWDDEHPQPPLGSHRYR